MTDAIKKIDGAVNIIQHDENFHTHDGICPYKFKEIEQTILAVLQFAKDAIENKTATDKLIKELSDES